MKGAFVIRLGPGTKPSENRFEGWAEEVDSGKEVKFHSLAELITFFGQRFEMALKKEDYKKNALNEIQSRDEDL
jgi:hypothetical protein